MKEKLKKLKMLKLKFIKNFKEAMRIHGEMLIKQNGLMF